MLILRVLGNKRKKNSIRSKQNYKEDFTICYKNELKLAECCSLYLQLEIKTGNEFNKSPLPMRKALLRL
ncbi:hypothetical protein BpHYR1_054435 [Brachionus plicatilis]|uniref:Uncharacterized protein n=1 Tax=Brachionus plicatilis TaxID=10195 RepID=A0A3M7SIW9_BRAPC|nr:hypothetical protein BpHYR1_054435 [Brachionus plicatilis]